MKIKNRLSTFYFSSLNLKKSETGHRFSFFIFQLAEKMNDLKIQALKSYPEKSFSLNFGHPFDVIIIKPNRSCYYVQKGHGFRETLVTVIVSTFLIFMFVDQLLLVDEFSQLHLCQKTTMLEVLL